MRGPHSMAKSTILRIIYHTILEVRRSSCVSLGGTGQSYLVSIYLLFTYSAQLDPLILVTSAALTHAWVNLDYMLDECLVGFMTSESSS